MKIFKSWILACGLIITVFASQAQKKEMIDGIIAHVGDEIVLLSDIEKMMLNYTFPDSLSNLEARCELLKTSIFEKLLLNQARIDSIEVSDDEVESELNRRMNYFINQLGSKEALENYYKKSISEIKDEMREPLKEMKLIEKMKAQITGDYEISPSEVKEFFQSLPEDSLPYYNTEVEVSHILIFPKPTEEEDKKALEKIKELKKRIEKGDKFETLAVLYSDDDASATKGGDLGMHNKADFVPEFSAAALKLKKDSISPPVKTEFGYHLIKMVERKGESFHVKHILIKPQITASAIQNTMDKLSEIRNEILNDTLTFEEAAYKYSEDELTRNNGGAIFDQNTGSTRISVDKMDPRLFFIIDTMEVGEISSPLPYRFPDGRTAYRLIYLKSKIPPHKANLEDDYPKIKTLAEEAYHMKVLQEWIDKALKKTYITVKPPYDQCRVIQEDILSKSNKKK